MLGGLYNSVLSQNYKKGDCYDIESCILFVGNFVPIHPGLGNFLDLNLLFIEDSRLLITQPKSHR